jgi:hypothetical protein
MAYVIVRDGFHDEADFCETLSDVQSVLQERFDDDPEYFQQIAGDFTIYEVDKAKTVNFSFQPAKLVIDGLNLGPVAETPTVPAGKADFELLDLLVRRGTSQNPHPLKNEVFTLSKDSPNDYNKEKLPIIPAGSAIRIDFTGDFGLYGFVNLNGVIEKIRIELKDLVKADFDAFL